MIFPLARPSPPYNTPPTTLSLPLLPLESRPRALVHPKAEKSRYEQLRTTR